MIEELYGSKKKGPVSLAREYTKDRAIRIVNQRKKELKKKGTRSSSDRSRRKSGSTRGKIQAEDPSGFGSINEELVVADLVAKSLLIEEPKTRRSNRRTLSKDEPEQDSTRTTG